MVSFANFGKKVNNFSFFLAKLSKIFQTTTVQAEQRQQSIVDAIREKEFFSLHELAEMLNTSVSTIRRDVNALQERGILKRTHGGIRCAEQIDTRQFTDTIPNIQDNAERKQRIAGACASLISPGQTVIMDAGSTVYNVAKLLVNKHPIVLTNSLPITNHYSSFSQVEVHVTGGVVYPRLGVLTGPNAVEGFSRIHADIAIMGAGGLSESGDITNTHALLIDMQLAMLAAAQKVILCLDSSKLGKKSLFYLCHIDRIHTLVTDSDANPQILDRLRNLGIHIVIA